ncbi:LacI family DNA-binding transcriptional regulator [Brachybacterium sp. DNPG3]
MPVNSDDATVGGRRRRAPTSQDVARLAGVAQSTVSYVLTGSRPISPATRQRVEAAIEELGYHPNSGARALRSKRSGVIGLMVPDADGARPVTMRFVGTIARETRRHGYDLLLVTAQEGADGVRRVVRTGICEALILMEVSRHDERMEALLESHLPFVLIGTPEDLPDGSAVDLDFEALGRMVVEHAASTGADELMIVGSPARQRHRSDTSRFLTGVEDALTEHPLTLVLDEGSFAELPDRVRARFAASEAAASAASEAAAAAADSGSTTDSGSTADGGRMLLFGLGGIGEVLFALATGSLLDDPRVGVLALGDDDLAEVSPLLSGIPRIDPRRDEVSELAVREVVRLLREDSASPRVTLVAPRAPGPAR